MKAPCGVIIALMVTSVAAAEQSRSTAAVPQPRMRLDPITRAAIADPKKEEQKKPSDFVIKMSPFIVKSIPINANEPEQERQPTGPFSPLTGGWIGRKETGNVLIEVGAWPYRNIMWKADRFKSDMNHVGTEFLRFSW
jgi:hypothetical protein